jgi:hypothetical protein
MVAKGVPDFAGMAWAQINSQRVYEKHTDLQPKDVCDLIARRMKF